MTTCAIVLKDDYSQRSEKLILWSRSWTGEEFGGLVFGVRSFEGRKPVSALSEEIFGHLRPGFQCRREASGSWLADEDVAALADEFHFLDGKAQFFGEADGLAVAGLEDFGDRHRGTPSIEVYTGCVYRKEQEAQA